MSAFDDLPNIRAIVTKHGRNEQTVFSARNGFAMK